MINVNPKAPKRDIWSRLYSDENISSLIDRAYYTDNVDPVVPEEALKELFAKAQASPLSTKDLRIEGLPNNTGLNTTASLAGNWMADNKLKTAGLAGTGLMNLSGLFDNDKLVGQGVGLGAGFAAGKILPGLLKKNPLTGSGLALATMGGGALGSLFDKLMAKKAEEEAAMQAYAGQY